MTRDDLHEIRRKIVQLHLDAIPVMEIVGRTGLSWPAVNAAIKQYEAGGDTALKFSRRGRKLGTNRALSLEQEAEIQGLIQRKRPFQCKVSGTRLLRSENPKLFLWNRDAVTQLIEQKHAIKLSARGVAKYLGRWGFLHLKEKLRPIERCSKEVKSWLLENYSIIRQRAQAEDAEIYWLTRTPLVNAETEQASVRRERSQQLSMVSAITNRGKVHWLVIKGVFVPTQQNKFLKALIGQSRKKVFLIRDDLKCYNKNEVMDWLRENKKRIELFPPPK